MACASSQPGLFRPQQAHEFRNRQARVGVVDVEDRLVGQQLVVVSVPALKILQRVLQAGGHQEIVLAQPQRLALVMVVLGVKHLGDHVGQVLLLGGAHIVAHGKGGQVQPLLGARAPGAQGVDRSLHGPRQACHRAGFHSAVIDQRKMSGPVLGGPPCPQSGPQPSSMLRFPRRCRSTSRQALPSAYGWLRRNRPYS